MRFLSICSGIEAASVAFHPLGWQALAFAEIEPFPCSLLAHHYPQVPNLGDLTRWREWSPQLLAQADVLCGGTPCQAFSVAGLRGSLSDERGNLTLTFCHLFDEIDHQRHLHGRPPAVCLWENVPGVFSTHDNAFGCFLAGLAGEDVPLEPPGGKWTDAGAVRGPRRAVAWRVLDAQYCGLAQRRKRVFVVASADPAFDPVAVLFELAGLRRDTPPRRGPGEGTSCGFETGPSGGQFTNVAPTLDTRCKDGPIRNQLGLGVAERVAGVPEVANCLTRRMHKGLNTTLDEGQTPIVEVCVACQEPSAAKQWRVRRLTPEECEMLQGFPIGYTLIPGTSSKKRKGDDLRDTIDYLISLGVSPAEAEVLAHSPDGPRYKALGNSWAVPVARWIARRIDACTVRQQHVAKKNKTPCGLTCSGEGPHGAGSKTGLAW